MERTSTKISEPASAPNSSAEKSSPSPQEPALETSNTESVDSNIQDAKTKEAVNDENDDSAIENAELPPEEQNDYNAAVAAAVADFDAEDEGEENGDDVVNVIIKPSSKAGIYKTGATYQARSISHVNQHSKATRQGIELDDPGDIHGVPTIEFNLSTLGEEEKPWKRPGADITDYFNYGFTEETWVQYCEKQKILRQEYANATLKPVLGTGGTGLLQRIRTGNANTGIRSYDTFKQANINVISLSTAALGGRTSTANLLGQKTVSSSDTSTTLINGASNASTNLLTNFTQPPPGYLTSAAQVNGAGANPAVPNSSVFNVPPPGFPPVAASGASQLLNAASFAAGANCNGIFPNIAIPPPMLSTLQNWPGAVGVQGLLGAGDTIVDPATGQISTLIEQSGHSPESVYSNEDRSSRRGRRHYHPDDAAYFERESYRPRRRSRSSSRDRHSRHRRHHESGRSDRDYDRRSGGTRHSRRSRERVSREERYSGGGVEDTMDQDGFCPPTSAVLSSSRDRRSDRDHGRADRSGGRERSSHRSSRHERDRSSRSRRSRNRSGSRSSHRRGTESPGRSPPSSANESLSKPDELIKPTDPLAVAAAAAANIAAALGTTAKSPT
ncbi:unnamed protein product [Calicophoron daubneyi]|uniref:Pre-mRNA polyadenylation factor Fip1 domain-containing protein n=1 Tax=Calicophoron daubneyi TaxID=300641 RepID=A0AAV2TU55_CALDB